jgi:hypothetical protein
MTTETATKGRYIVVIETQHVVKKSTFHKRYFDSKRQAISALNRAEQRQKNDMWKRVYMVDTVLQPHIVF